MVNVSTLSSRGSKCPFGQKTWKGVFQNDCGCVCLVSGIINDVTFFSELALVSNFLLNKIILLLKPKELYFRNCLCLTNIKWRLCNGEACQSGFCIPSSTS